ncbi:NACHT, LRR and PYD domains-containing protein 12-like [Alosa pseudoharengus]|uniref:NACHT, LRR and PYD domains-containing protein 12-like n=1 Tax=Alosa pseudoharengus TaxID=34774 RepID=UPI003F8B0356
MDALKLLLRTLEDLKAKELKKFQLFLTVGALEGFDRIPKGKLEKCDPPDTAGIMEEAYGIEGALRVTLLILKEMNHNELAEKLEKELEKRPQTHRPVSVVPSDVSMKSDVSMENPLTFNSGPQQSDSKEDAESGEIDEGENVQDSNKEDDDAIQKQVSQHLKNDLKKKYASLLEGPEETKVQLDEVYTELHVTEGVSEEVNTQHEVQQIQAKCQQMQTKCHSGKDIIIKCNDIMNSSSGEKVRTVMTIGIAGIGKSVSVQKFCLDWAEGRTNQDIDFIFVLPFRELNLVNSEQYSFHSLLLSFYPELTELNDVKIYGNSKILFVFDGLDESKLELNFPSTQKLYDLTQISSVGILLTNLIQGHLLQSSLIWITSRPAAANQIPSSCVDKWTEIRGFNDTQKDAYFSNRMNKYFSKRMENDHTDKIILQIKTRRSLYIMCHIPVFCWILVCVLQDMLTPNSNMEIPTTMTELFIHFLIMQTNRKNQRCSGESEKKRTELLKRHKEHILKLSELAFKQLEKGNLLFSETDLTESDIKDNDITEYSEMFTKIFKKDRIFFKRPFYCFVHLSVQEFLAALHVFYSFVSGNYEALKPFTGQMCAPVSDGAEASNPQLEEKKKNPSKIKTFFKRIFLQENEPSAPHKDDTDQKRESPLEKKISLHVLLNGAVDKSLQSNNGHLDLFLRFLFGISLESNQELLHGLLPHVEDTSKSVKTTSEYIKKMLSEGSNAVERCQNLLLCLLEMKDSSLHEEVKGLMKSKQYLTPAQCSLQAYMLLMSEDVLDELNLRTYDTSQDGRERLLIVLRVCKKAQLASCDLSGDSCKEISSVLQLENSLLTELDLSYNPLKDSGVELLSAGLKHTNCRLDTLRLVQCRLSGDSCKEISSVFQSENSLLRELDLSRNPLKDSGVELLSAGLKHTNCRLDTLRLAECKLSENSWKIVATVLQSPNSLIELDLSHNDLEDSGVQLLSKGLPSPHCKLQTLRLAYCKLTDKSCEIVASVLQSANSLQLLDLSENDLGDSGVQLLSKGLSSSNCKIHTLRLSDCLISEKGCGFLASALTSHLKHLDLTYNDPGESGLKLLSARLEDPVCKPVILRTDHALDRARPRLLKYACDLTLDPNTAHRRLSLSEGNRKVTRVREQQPYPEHPERFDSRCLVLCREGLTGRCYWEAEWSGDGADISDISVAYKSIERKGGSDDVMMGRNAKSWSLECSPHHSYYVLHNNEHTYIPAPSSRSRTVGVYLDWPAGTLSFYSVSTNTLTHLHTFHSTFTEPLCPGFLFYYYGSSVSLRKIT